MSRVKVALLGDSQLWCNAKKFVTHFWHDPLVCKVAEIARMSGLQASNGVHAPPANPRSGVQTDLTIRGNAGLTTFSGFKRLSSIGGHFDVPVQGSVVWNADVHFPALVSVGSFSLATDPELRDRLLDRFGERTRRRAALGRRM